MRSHRWPFVTALGAALAATACGARTLGTVFDEEAGPAGGADGSVVEADSGRAPRVATGAGCADAGALILRASDYDQSCTIDSDCVSVSPGVSCRPSCAMGCPTAVMSRRALDRYQADVDALLRELAADPPECRCLADIRACCLDQRCASGRACGAGMEEAGARD